jgi:hypothetical protein
MKCDGCGCQFSAREAETATKNEPVSPAGRMPYTKLVAMVLCPDCVASRAATRRFVTWMVVLLPVAAVIVGALGSLLAQFLR